MTEISNLHSNIYKEGSPLIIESGVLYHKDGRYLIELSFFSISDVPISGVTVDVHVFDRANIEIEVIRDFAYKINNAERNTNFGADTTIDIVNSAGRSFSIALRQVKFSNDTVWHGSNSILSGYLPDLKPLEEEFHEKELAQQYVRDFSDKLAKDKAVKAKYVPSAFDDIWFCSCGYINTKTEAECHHCRADLIAQLYHVRDVAKIIHNLNEHHKHLEYLAEQARLEAERKAEEERQAILEAERKAEEERLAKEAELLRLKRKKQRIIATVSATAIVIVAFIIVYISYILPNMTYTGALTMVNEGEYSEAIEAFVGLGDFRDSEQQIIETRYIEAMKENENGNYGNALVIASEITESKDVTEIEYTAYYGLAIAEMDSENYDEAIVYFANALPYADSYDQNQKAHLIQAEKYINENDLAKAVPYYDVLEATYSTTAQETLLAKGTEVFNTEDTESAKVYFDLLKDESIMAQAKELYYVKANTLLTEASYDEAIDLFSYIADYKDTDILLNQIDYEKGLALFNQGEYTEAITHFEQAEDYPSASAMVLESKYQIAEDEYNNGNYQTAADLYTEIATYNDAQEMVYESLYRLGVQLLNSGEVLEAYNVLYPINEQHFDAYALLVESSEFYRQVYNQGLGENPQR